MEKPIMEIHAILQPADFSAHGQKAFELACSLARDHKARVLVLHVYHPQSEHEEVTKTGHHEKYQDHLWNKLREVRPPKPDVNV
jgi:hypothetical protein